MCPAMTAARANGGEKRGHLFLRNPACPPIPAGSIMEVFRVVPDPEQGKSGAAFPSLPLPVSTMAERSPNEPEPRGEGRHDKSYCETDLVDGAAAAGGSPGLLDQARRRFGQLRIRARLPSSYRHFPVLKALVRLQWGDEGDE